MRKFSANAVEPQWNPPIGYFPKRGIPILHFISTSHQPRGFAVLSIPSNTHTAARHPSCTRLICTQKILFRLADFVDLPHILLQHIFLRSCCSTGDVSLALRAHLHPSPESRNSFSGPSLVHQDTRFRPRKDQQVNARDLVSDDGQTVADMISLVCFNINS